MKAAVLYGRVSSKEQADEGFSIPAQLKLLREYAVEHGFEIAREFVDVETAKQTGRQPSRRWWSTCAAGARRVGWRNPKAHLQKALLLASEPCRRAVVFRMAGLTGLEPATSGLTGRHSKPTELQPQDKKAPAMPRERKLCYHTQ